MCLKLERHTNLSMHLRTIGIMHESHTVTCHSLSHKRCLHSQLPRRCSDEEDSSVGVKGHARRPQGKTMSAVLHVCVCVEGGREGGGKGRGGGGN